MLKAIVITGVLAGAIFGGGKLYLHARVAHAVDQVIASQSSAAEISYSGVTSSLTGEVGIENLHIKPHGVADSVKIDSVTVQFPGLGYVAQLEDNFKSKNYPESLFLSVDNMSLSTSGALIRTFEEAAAAQMVTSDGNSGCVSPSSGTASQLRELGYDRLAIDYTAGYQHDSTTGELSLSGQIKQHSAMDVHYEVVVPMTSLSDAGAAVFMADPALVRGSFSIQDDGYYDRLVAHCSKIEGADPATITKDLLSVWTEQMSAMGIPPDQQMLSDYHQFLTSGDSFTMKAIPREPVRFQYLSLYEPKDIPNLLNIATAAH